ncbi:MAG: SDR family oxidoreductase [Planctomycetaceae bacterium]|nr:SDR family oxidoreductase [Planctomycetaceae bacterium]
MTFADLTGKRIAVTGASSGIGRAIALECVRGGAQVVVGYRRSDTAAVETVKEIERLGGRAFVVRVDVSCESARRQFVERCFAEGPVDAIVNNAGVDLLTGDNRDLPYDVKLSMLLAVDVTGTVMLSREFGRRFRAQGSGSILTIGWDQSDRGMEGDSGELFAAAKNAVMGFTRSLSVSLAPEVRVNCIAPGWIQTAWGETASEYWQNRVLSETPLKRWGLPQDIANMARFLLSDSASYVTGQVINVNGGAVR